MESVVILCQTELQGVGAYKLLEPKSFFFNRETRTQRKDVM